MDSLKRITKLALVGLVMFCSGVAAQSCASVNMEPYDSYISSLSKSEQKLRAKRYYFSAPKGFTQITPLSHWPKLWEEVRACANSLDKQEFPYEVLDVAFKDVKFWTFEEIWILDRIAHIGAEVLGWGPRGHVAVRQDKIQVDRIVKHEMLHQFIPKMGAKGAHDKRVFKICAGD